MYTVTLHIGIYVGILTSSGLNWANENTSPTDRPAVCIVGRHSKICANVVTPFSVGGGCHSANGAFGTNP